MKLTMSGLKRLIHESFLGDSFDMQRLLDISKNGDEEYGHSIDQRMYAVQDYAKEHLKMLGRGWGRIVYRLDDNSVLKVAMNALSGTEQNAHEAQVSSTSHHLPIAKVLRADPNGLWVISELVKPVKDDDEFFSLSGIDVSDLREQIEELQHDAAEGVNVTQSYVNDDFIWSVWQLVEDGNLAIADVAVSGHWGVTNSGRLVVLDYGFTKGMYNSMPNFMKF